MANHEDPQKLISFLRSLRAVRQFRAEPVPEEVIKSDFVHEERYS